jgi:hypothetical protein
MGKPSVALYLTAGGLVTTAVGAWTVHRLEFHYTVGVSIIVGFWVLLAIVYLAHRYWARKVAGAQQDKVNEELRRQSEDHERERQARSLAKHEADIEEGKRQTVSGRNAEDERVRRDSEELAKIVAMEVGSKRDELYALFLNTFRICPGCKRQVERSGFYKTEKGHRFIKCLCLNCWFDYVKASHLHLVNERMWDDRLQ